MGYSKDLERQANDYAEELEQNIVTAIDNVTGASSGNLTNAIDLVSDKIKMLKRKSDNFNHLANQISDLLEVAIQMDQEVADTIAMQSRYKLVHNESGRLENWIDKILKLLVSIGDNKLVMKLIADRLKALFPGSRFTKDFIIEWYKEALTEYVYYEKSDWMSGYGKEVRLFPDLKNDPDNGNVNLKNVIKNWYKNPDPKQNSKTEDKEDRNLLPYEQDLKKLLTARNLPQAYRYLFKYLWDRYPGLYSEQMKQMAIIGGMDPEWAEIYGDFATMPLLEGFAVVTVKGVQAIKNLKTGEIIYSESVVAGSGVGNLTNKASGGPKGIREGAGNAGKAIKGSGAGVKSGTGRGYTVDSTMFPDDEAAGVLRNGEYVKNPTAHNINDYITEGTNYLGNKNMNGQYMYVVDMDRNIVLGTRGGQRMPHPTLVGGKNPQVQAVGMVEIRGGKIYSINNASGHFKPSSECLKTAEEVFGNLPQNIYSKDFQGFLPYGE